MSKALWTRNRLDQALDTALGVLEQQSLGKKGTKQHPPRMTPKRYEQRWTSPCILAADPFTNFSGSQFVPAETTLAALQQLKNHIEGRLNSLSTRPTTPSLLDKIPDEVLVNILQFALADDPNPYHRSMANIMTVRRKWYQVMDASPGFWSHLSVHDSAACIAMKLRKSKNAALCVDLEEDWSNSDRGPFLSRLSDTMHRWKAIRCTGRDIGVLKPYLAEELERLESLDLGFMDTMTPIMDLAGGPNLRHVRLLGVALSAWDGLRDLHSLTISRVQPSLIPPLALFEALMLCPNLHVLDLEDIQANARHFNDEIEPSVVTATLPFTLLQKLRLWQVAPTISVPLLRGLRLEHLGTFHIHSTWLNGRDQAVEDVFKLDPATSHSLFSLACSKARDVRIRIEDGGMNIEATGWLDEEIAVMKVRSDRLLGILESVGHRMPFLGPCFKGATHLEYRRSQKSTDATPISSFLQRLPSITSIKLGGHAQRGLPVLQCLSLPDEDGSWICPNLVEIDLDCVSLGAVVPDALEWVAGVPDLVNMVGQRNGAVLSRVSWFLYMLAQQLIRAGRQTIIVRDRSGEEIADLSTLLQK